MRVDRHVNESIYTYLNMIKYAGEMISTGVLYP
jgi:hypothetical protein